MRTTCYAFVIGLLLISNFLIAQKSVYIPNYLRDTNDPNGAQFTWDKTAESDNFILIWGNTVGTDPANHPDPDLQFVPQQLLDTMEFIYDEFKTLDFVDDAPGTRLAEFKVPIIIYNTWGPNGAMGWANGGDADGVIGAFWVHPNAMRDGAVAAHEFTHSMQAQANIDARTINGLGPVWQNAGIFWETHANFMRNLLYPSAVTAWGMDVYHVETWGDWKNTYENYQMLLAIMDSEGIEMINRLWRESNSDEYPLQAYKRLAGLSDNAFNDSMYHYVRRMATFDFNHENIGDFFRQYRAGDLQYFLPSTQATYTILNEMPGSNNRYEVPIHLAPEEFAYNIIPLQLDADSCGALIKFKGHTEVNNHAGWRYGFVTEKPDGTLGRYSETYSADEKEVYFHLQAGETKMYFVVMGAPKDGIQTNTSNDTWKGYPKHFRYPYEIAISGAKPEGYQEPIDFRSTFRLNGSTHPNGGGFVENTASVSPTVYVGAHAMVLGNAALSGNVRIENTALVRDAAISGEVVVKDNAFVLGGNYSDNVVIAGQAFVENTTMSGNALVHMRARVANYILSGNVEVGGDVVVYNQNGNCDNGVHYVLTNYYDDKVLQCDGRTADHPDNADVNNPTTPFDGASMQVSCDCIKKEAFQIAAYQTISPTCEQPELGRVDFSLSNFCGPFDFGWRSSNLENGSRLENLKAGTYFFTITDALGRRIEEQIEITPPKMIEAGIQVEPYDCDNGEFGTASVFVNQSNGKVSFEWSDGSTNNDLMGLEPGDYQLIVTDTAGCTLDTSITIERVGDLELFTDVRDQNCHIGLDASARILAPDGISPITWDWEDGSDAEFRQDLDEGNYAVTVTDALGCANTFEFEIGPPEEILIDAAVTDAGCDGAATGSIILMVDATGAYTLAWSTGATGDTLENLQAGLYEVFVLDENGCSDSLAINVDAGGDILLDITYPDTLCFQDTAQIDYVTSGGTAPYSFLYEYTGPYEFGGAGMYTLTVSDSLGCSTTENFEIAEHPEILATVASEETSGPGQEDGSLSVEMISGGAGGYQFAWSNGVTGPNNENLSPGFYDLTISDRAGCSWEGTFEVEEGTTSLFEPAVNDFQALVFPNPSNGSGVFLKVKTGFNYKSDLRVFDVAGRVIFNQSFDVMPAQIQLPAFENKGFYWIELKGGDAKKSLLKLVVE